MIVEVKNIIVQAIIRHAGIPAERIARKMCREKELMAEGTYPFAAMVTNPEKFDNRFGREVKYFDKEEGIYKQRITRVGRNLPLVVRIWGDSEESADTLSSSIIRNMPQRWEYDGFEGSISFLSAEHSDHVTKVVDKYLSTFVVVFSIEVAGDPEPVPTIARAVSQPES